GELAELPREVALGRVPVARGIAREIHAVDAPQAQVQRLAPLRIGFELHVLAPGQAAALECGLPLPERARVLEAARADQARRRRPEPEHVLAQPVALVVGRAMPGPRPARDLVVLEAGLLEPIAQPLAHLRERRFLRQLELAAGARARE